MSSNLSNRREFLGAAGLAATALVLPGFGSHRQQSSGEYKGQKWCIDENHLMWWDAKSYVRFGFTGNGDPAQMLKAGFEKFTLMPSEQWSISGPDPGIVQDVNEMSDQLEKAGATYYGTLNAFWPWPYGNLIAESDKAVVFIRDVRDVTQWCSSGMSGTSRNIRRSISPWISGSTCLLALLLLSGTKSSRSQCAPCFLTWKVVSATTLVISWKAWFQRSRSPVRMLSTEAKTKVARERFFECD